jgi:hypothetical protein
MDDLIVIILTLIFAAAGIFGQMKKKQAASQKEPQPEPQPEIESEDSDNFWDFLEPESNKNYMEQAPVPEPAKQKQPVQTVAEEPVQKKPKYQFNAENEGTSIYANDLTSDAKAVKKARKRRKDRFSLKKEVIYSEILNRKYS